MDRVLFSSFSSLLFSSLLFYSLLFFSSLIFSSLLFSSLCCLVLSFIVLCCLAFVLFYSLSFFLPSAKCQFQGRSQGKEDKLGHSWKGPHHALTVTLTFVLILCSYPLFFSFVFVFVFVFVSYVGCRRRSIYQNVIHPRAAGNLTVKEGAASCRCLVFSCLVMPCVVLC